MREVWMIPIKLSAQSWSCCGHSPTQFSLSALHVRV
jgi:hypothetical protein